MKSKKYFSILILLLVTFLVLYFSLRNNFEMVIEQVLSINIYWLVISLVLIFGYWYFKSLILYYQTRKFKDDYTFGQAFKLNIVTQFFNAITPFASGGQPFQIYTLKKDGLAVSEGTNVIVNDTIVYQLSVTILGIFALVCNGLFDLFPNTPLLLNLVVIGFLVNTSVVVFLFAVSFIPKLDKWIINIGIKICAKIHIVKDEKKTVSKWASSIESFSESAKKLLASKKEFAKMILYNVFGLLCLYLLPLSIMYGMGYYHAFNPLIAIVVSSYVQLIGAFVPIPGGAGGLEYCFLLFFKNYIGDPMLTSLMLIWRFISYYLGMIVGAIVLNVKSRRRV